MTSDELARVWRETFQSSAQSTTDSRLSGSYEREIKPQFDNGQGLSAAPDWAPVTDQDREGIAKLNLHLEEVRVKESCCGGGCHQKLSIDDAFKELVRGNDPATPTHAVDTSTTKTANPNYDHKSNANNMQVGGHHYIKRKLQPWDVIAEWDLDFFQGNVIKYVARWKDKNGIEDLEKALHYLQKYIEVQKDREANK